FSRFTNSCRCISGLGGSSSESCARATPTEASHAAIRRTNVFTELLLGRLAIRRKSDWVQYIACGMPPRKTKITLRLTIQLGIRSGIFGPLPDSRKIALLAEYGCSNFSTRRGAHRNRVSARMVAAGIVSLGIRAKMFSRAAGLRRARRVVR